MTLAFTVLGHPEPQGSMRSYIPKGWSRAILTSDNKKLKPWRQQVGMQALFTMQNRSETISREAIQVSATFYFAKPRSAPRKLLHKITKPDIDKCSRSILDALTGIVFADDGQVVSISCHKRFGLPERVQIEIITLPVNQFLVTKEIRRQLDSR